MWPYGGFVVAPLFLPPRRAGRCGNVADVRTMFAPPPPLPPTNCRDFGEQLLRILAFGFT